MKKWCYNRCTEQLRPREELSKLGVVGGLRVSPSSPYLIGGDGRWETPRDLREVQEFIGKRAELHLIVYFVEMT